MSSVINNLNNNTSGLKKLGLLLSITCSSLLFSPVAVGNTYGDELSQLLEEKINKYTQNTNAYEQQVNQIKQYDYPLIIRHSEHQHIDDNSYSWGETASFRDWYGNHYNRSRANAYQQYLEQRLGKNNVPPMSELLLTARSWSSCGASKYEVPPSYLWSNMLSTLDLYAKLKTQNVLPSHTVIRSVYRNPTLNSCARGAKGSKHKMNAAIDIWIPEFSYQPRFKENVQDNVCEFWLYYGKRYDFGLGIYSTGSIHLDTQGYRKWGGRYTPKNSLCRLS